MLKIAALSAGVITQCSACALCHTANAAQLRANLFSADFWPTFLKCLLPFPILLGVVVCIYFPLPLPAISSLRK